MRWILIVTLLFSLNFSARFNLMEKGNASSTNGLGAISCDQKEISYDTPDKYIIPGPQSLIPQNSKQYDFLLALKNKKSDMETLKNIYHFINSDKFHSFSGGGSSIGKTTALTLLASHQLSGCHDYALLFTSILKYLDHPALMVDTFSINWARKFKKNETNGFEGHAMLETFIEIAGIKKWVLVDAVSGQVIKNYSKENHYIPITLGPERTGYYVMFKGNDPADYGIDSNEHLTKCMEILSDIDKNGIRDYTPDIERLK